MARPKRNEFSWSISRDATFRRCLRQYWYDHYGTWGGWEAEAPAETREAWVLKKLKTRPLWVGDLVHRAVARSLTNLSRGVAVLPPERVIEITLNLMRNEFRHSRRGGWKEGRGFGLFEHAYEVPVTDEEWRASAADVEASLRTFYASPLWDRLSALPPEAILEVELPRSFDLEGTRCWAVLDAAWRDGDGVTVADWKTGQTEPGGVELQMTVYALYAAGRWGLDPGDLTLLEYNLRHDRVHRYRADRATVERTRSYIRGSIADMTSLLADPLANLPLPDDRFVRVSRREICSRCNYLRVCNPPWIEPSAAAG